MIRDTSRPIVYASIEARMNSSRLPGKMMLDIGGVPLIDLMIKRVAQAELIDGIILATTTSSDDNMLADVGFANGIKVYRGSEQDVLNRVVQAHLSVQSDIIVELCGDCPLLDATIIDRGLSTFLKKGVDVLSTGVEQSYPQGQDVQIFRTRDLQWIEENISDPAVREHVSLYFYEHPEKYKIHSLQAPEGLSDPSLRLQVDYREDYELICSVHQELSKSMALNYKLNDILALIEAQPYLRQINHNCIEKNARE